MPIPTRKDIVIPLLHLIHDMGGQVKPNDIYEKLADYFGLNEKERNEMQPSGLSKKFDNRVQWTRLFLCQQGFIDRSTRGVWKLTEKGRKEVSKVGLIGKPFPISARPSKERSLSVPKEAKKETEIEEIFELVRTELAPNGPKQFPDDFLSDKGIIDFYEMETPGTRLCLAPLSQTIVTSIKGYFRYQAKNPPEAKYILYSHTVGSKRVKIPKDNLILFKAVKSYEKYCDELTRKAFELFLEFTYDETRAEKLTKDIANQLGLRPKILYTSEQP